MKIKVLIGSLLLITFIVGCSGIGNSTALAGVKIANEKLEKDNSPIRYVANESQYGVSFQPYLIGKIAPSIADFVLKNDALKLIMQKENTQDIELVQTRFVSHSSDPVSFKEVWVVKRTKDNELHAHSIQFIQSPQSGTDIKLSGAARAFEEMLKKSQSEL